MPPCHGGYQGFESPRGRHFIIFILWQYQLRQDGAVQVNGSLHLAGVWLIEYYEGGFLRPLYIMAVKEAQVRRIQAWGNLPKEARQPNTVRALSRQEKLSPTTVTAILKGSSQVKDGGENEYDTFMAHLEVEVYKLNCPVRRQELYAQLKGWKVEKQEVTHKVDGSFFARAANDAERDLREAGFRVDEVQKKLPLLPPELCEATGQKPGEKP